MSPPIVYAFEGLVPVVHPTAFVHPSAVLLGDVIVGERAYVGPCAVMRGDFGRIELRGGANLQDNCVVHSLPDFDCVLEEDAHVGHGVVERDREQPERKQVIGLQVERASSARLRALHVAAGQCRETRNPVDER